MSRVTAKSASFSPADALEAGIAENDPHIDVVELGEAVAAGLTSPEFDEVNKMFSAGMQRATLVAKPNMKLDEALNRIASEHIRRIHFFMISGDDSPQSESSF